jgi:hypothetical protein
VLADALESQAKPTAINEKCVADASLEHCSGQS